MFDVTKHHVFLVNLLFLHAVILNVVVIFNNLFIIYF